MRYRKSSLTRSFIKRVAIIFVLIALLITAFYRWGFPTYYYWKLEQPVKEAQQKIQSGQTIRPTDDLVVVATDNTSSSSEEDLTSDLAFRLDREGISLNRFWVDQTTIQAVKKSGKSVQRLYNQTKQKSDFYTIFFSKGETFYLLGTSIPDFKAAIRTLLPILIAATAVFLLLVFGLIVLLVRNQIIKPLGRLEQTTRNISNLNFADSDIQEENELGSLSQSIHSMKQAIQQHELNLLEQNDRLKNFSSNLAHELKTPLSVIQLLVDGEEMGLENPDFLTDINQQLADINGLVTNLLAYSRQMKQELSLENVDLQKLIEKELAQQRIIAPNFQFQLTMEECQIKTNEQLLRVILLNLVTNGMKYSTDNQLSIRGQKQGSHYQLLFENAAAKLADQQFAQLREPFVVGEKSRNNHLSGTGLGLSIVEETLKALDGTLAIEQAEGKFIAIITLPIDQAAARN